MELLPIKYSLSQRVPSPLSFLIMKVLVRVAGFGHPQCSEKTDQCVCIFQESVLFSVFKKLISLGLYQGTIFLKVLYFTLELLILPNKIEMITVSY